MPSNWQELDFEASKAEDAVIALEALVVSTRKYAIRLREEADAEFQRWQNDKTA